MEDSPIRPQTVRKDSRKVPGGFDAEDLDDLSPTKERSDIDWDDAKAQMTNADRLPPLNLESLPSLPPDDSSSLFPASDGLTDHNDDRHMISLDEGAMSRHLNNIESSFLPNPEPLSTANSGIDDTYLFDNAPKDKSAEGTYEAAQTLNRDPDIEVATPQSPPTPPQHYRTPGLTKSNTPEPLDTPNDDAHNNTSSLETMSSSPTARAAARTVSRVLSHGNHEDYETTNDKSAEHSAQQAAEDESELTPKRSQHGAPLGIGSEDERSTVRNTDSSNSLRLSADAGSTPGGPLLTRRASSRRPRILRSRYSSQRSSTSSFITNPDSQDENGGFAPGVDYALQSGGAVPEGGTQRSNSFALSRSISLGSMASGLEDSASHVDLPSGDRALATLDEEERNRERRFSSSKREEHSPSPETPRAITQTMAAPTDTVIARHVRNVHVPESVANEYRNKNRVLSPDKISSFSVPLGRTGKNLTLKEQSSTIERLSKENFDLKLKVMFLSDRLDKLSEEGVKEMISENVDLKTALANIQRDNKTLRRKVRDLEQKVKDEEGRPSTARSGASSDDRNPPWFDQEGAQEREEELIYLRERVEEYEVEIEKMRNESLAREAEKRRMAEVVRTMGEKRGETFEAREEMDVWKDLLEQETARREQADEDNRKLRDEIFRLKTETTGGAGLNLTTSIYNISKKRQLSPTRPRSVTSERLEGTFSAASTLVDELRKESEQLRHENAELRREVGAQTSMLTSRNREKERLYQEIEDLKLGQRRGGGSIAGDSILDRSASRTRQRSMSRASAITKQTGLTDTEREEFDNQIAELRDKNNVLRMQNQDLQHELDACMQDFETAVQAKQQAEGIAREIQEELEGAENDLQTMQADRDEALRGQEEVEIEFDSLRKEAQEEIDLLENEAEQRNDELQKVQAELADRIENFSALQNEMRELSEALVRLEDVQDGNMRRIQDLENELDQANRELEEMEKSLIESNTKVNRLQVQLESSQGEISFLREEQDGDKIKIGDLEAALKNTEASLHEERERARDLERRLDNERKQRELVANKEKQEVQRIINDLNREASGAKDEARHLRRKLTKEEVEAAAWKARLTELENNLREALGDLNGTRASLLQVWHSRIPCQFFTNQN